MKIVIYSQDGDEHVEHIRTHSHCKEEELPFDAVAREIMTSDEFRKYIYQNGYHFTDELADKAAELMESKISAIKPWTTEQVREAIRPMIVGINNRNRLTDGDLTYFANMAKMDFFPTVIDTEEKCLRYAIAMATDIDGYEGVALMRFVSDLIGQELTDFKF